MSNDEPSGKLARSLVKWPGRQNNGQTSGANQITCKAGGCTKKTFFSSDQRSCPGCNTLYCGKECAENFAQHADGRCPCAQPGEAPAHAEVRTRMLQRRPQLLVGLGVNRLAQTLLAPRAPCADTEVGGRGAAGVAATILTFMGGEESFDQLLGGGAEATQISSGLSCAACGHGVLFLGYAPVRLLQQKKPAAVSHVGRKVTENDLDLNELLCCVCGWRRCLVPGSPLPPLQPVHALSDTQKKLLGEVLSNMTLLHQQAVTRRLSSCPPTCTDYQACAGGAAKGPAPRWTAAAAASELELPTGVCDIMRELNMIQGVTEKDRNYVRQLVGNGGSAQLVSEYVSYTLVPAVLHAEVLSVLVRMRALLAVPASPLLSAPRVIDRMARAALVLIGDQAHVPQSAQPAAAAATRSSGRIAAKDQPQEKGSGKKAGKKAGSKGSAKGSAKESEEGESEEAQGAAAGPSCGGARRPAQLGLHLLKSPYKGGVTSLHMDPIPAYNVAMATASSSSPDGAVLAEWVFVSPSALGEVMRLANELLESGKPLEEVHKLLHVGQANDDPRKKRPYFTEEGVKWLQEELAKRDFEGDNACIIVMQQTHGQVIKVPTGWAHQVTNKRPCIKLAFDHFDLENVAAHFEMLHLVRDIDDGLLPPDARLKATMLLLRDVPRVEQSMMEALESLVSTGTDVAIRRPPPVIARAGAKAPKAEKHKRQRPREEGDV